MVTAQDSEQARRILLDQQHVSLYEKARHVLCMTNHLHFIRGMQCFVGHRFYRGTVPHHAELLVAAQGL
jgi:hypothetical protein